MIRTRNISPVGTRARRGLTVAALVVLPLSACFRSVTEGGTITKYGAISILGAPSTGGNATATASAIFFQAYAVSVPDSRLQSNSCQYATVDTTHSTSPGVLRAGSSLSLLFGTSGATTQREMSFESATARYLSSTPTTYKANDSVTVAIPGDAAGFPASSIKIRLAEPLLPTDVTVPPTGTDMAVRWNASPDSTTAIILSLKYANPASSTYANEQIICALKDDGTEDISTSALGPFSLSPVALRSLKLTRWRTNAVTMADGSFLHIVTTVDSLVKLK
ncbi:MAG: hypothetical protein ABI852_15335 [Gemmatimonadaceae bacterium]